ncbi:MAG TPA: CRISPR system precrRNA processing endoribonuclease RAMP protein Cas6 [Minicystis sp.]|nr:CRISPR system precrRNA processing endoribonuclease RAMP protein Cas6 [Minicystis sp.]
MLADPNHAAPALPARTATGLGVTLVGTAVVELPYFVVAVRRLGDDGIGPSRVRFRVRAVRSVDAAGIAGDVVYEHGSDLVRPVRAPLRAGDLTRPGDGSARRARVRFTTPTDVRGNGSVPGAAPSFGALLRRARDRASALATFFGDGPIDVDARRLGEIADAVATRSSDVSEAGIVRRSSRTGDRHEVSGVVGSAVYEGDALGELLPWLRVAELIGVGKHATFGAGRIGVDVLG